MPLEASRDALDRERTTFGKWAPERAKSHLFHSNASRGAGIDLWKMGARTSESDSANLTDSASSGGLFRRNELVSNLRGAKRRVGAHFPTVLISSSVSVNKNETNIFQS